jgi:hypothetical protein
MASAATEDPPLPEPMAPPHLADDATGRSSRRVKSRKRKSGEAGGSEGQEKKRTFDDFFNFCSFVLAYEEQLERQAMASENNSPHPPTTTISTISTHTKGQHINNNSHHHQDSNTSDDHNESRSNGTTPRTIDASASSPPQNHHSHQPHRDHTSSPVPPASTGSTSTSSSDSSESGEEERGRGASVSASKDSSNDEQLEYTSEDESWNLVTCFCRRPFAGRPMIECSKCNTWVHLFCAKIRKSAVPEVYTCPKCIPKTTTTTSSSRRSTPTS